MYIYVRTMYLVYLHQLPWRSTHEEFVLIQFSNGGVHIRSPRIERVPASFRHHEREAQLASFEGDH